MKLRSMSSLMREGAPMARAIAPGTWATLGLLALLLAAVHGAAAAPPKEGQARRSAPLQVDLDLLPEDRDNVVDPIHSDRVAVAILGRPGFDVRSIDPLSLLLAGAPVSKDEDGSTASWRDVNSDGHEDVVVCFPEKVLASGAGASGARLHGRLLDGTPIEGSDRYRTMQEIRMAARPNGAMGHPHDKRPPVPVRIDVLPGDPANVLDPTRRESIPVAILGSAGFDATSIDPATVVLAGAPATRAPRGSWTRDADLDGDGRADLLIHVAPEALLRLPAGPHDVQLDALTFDGRFVLGRDRLNVPAIRTITMSSDTPPTPSGPVVQSADSTSITINDNGPATPFPATITIAPGGSYNQWVGKVRVTLKDLTHTFPADLDVMLVGPQGQSVILMSDAGGGAPGFAGIDLTFDDDASEYLSQAANPTPGLWKPTNYDDGVPDGFGGLAPTPSRSPGLSAFNGTSPAGAWSLYVFDDAPADTGVIAGGWSIEIVIMEVLCFGDGYIDDNGTYQDYPALLQFTAPGTVSKATLHMRLTHPSPDDLDVLVESPSGRLALALSDAGGNAPVSSVNLRLDGDAPGAVPDSALTTGSFRPVDYDDGVPDVFPAPAPASYYPPGLDNLWGSPVAGMWKAYVVDDTFTGASGFLSGFCLGLAYTTPSANASVGGITIPEGAPVNTLGASAPYPSTIEVSGMPGMVSKVTVEIEGLTHTFPDDLDILLVGPNGRTAVLMSDAGGGSALNGVHLTFDEEAAATPPDQEAIATGTYHPVDYEPGDAYPAPAPPGPYVSSFDLNGSDPNGTWSLYVVDDAGGDVGAIFSWKLNISTLIFPTSFCETRALTIPAGAPATTTGPADIYPSTIHVSGIDFPAGRIRVILNGLSHTYPDDLDVLLVGPGGESLVLMSDAGGSDDAPGAWLELNDTATTPLPDAGPLVTGVFTPTNYPGGDGDAFPVPAPPPSAATTLLGAFAGINPNGDWRLYVFDDAAGDVGVLAEGWCLEIRPLFVPAPGAPLLFFDDPTSLRLLTDPLNMNVVRWNLYRGTPNELPALLDPTTDSCSRASQNSFTFTLPEVPSLGSMYWYLARGVNAGGDEGSAGFANTALGAEARVQNSAGPCP